MSIIEPINSLSTFKKIVLLVFISLLLFFGVQLLRYHYLLVTFPYPLESFEGAMLLTTNLLLQGENPYALEHMPVAINVYGINYHLLVYPFAKLWGNTFLVHRTVSAIFLLLSCAFFFVVLQRHGINKLHSVSAVLILYASLLYRYTAVAKPDGLGLFLFLLSAFLPYLMEYSLGSLIVSVILGVTAFYTKAYFVLSIPYLATYLFLFVSKKKAILYGLMAFVSLVFTAIVFNKIFETYFVNTFFNHINVATNNLNQLRVQLEFFSLYYSGILIILGTYLALIAWDRFKGSPWSFTSTGKEFIKQIEVSTFDQPLFRVDFPLSLFCLLFSFILFYFKLGRHYGNIMSYAYHLISPFFLIYTYSLFNFPLKNPDLVKRRESYNYALLLPCILMSLYLLFSSATYLKDSPEWTDRGDWQRIEQILLSRRNIMNSQVLVSLLLAQNKPVYDTGQTEFFQYSHYPSGWLERFLLPNADVSKQWTAYEHDIDRAVRQKEFDAVIVTPRERRPYLQALPDYYNLTDTIGVCMFHTAQCAELEIWEPKAASVP